MAPLTLHEVDASCEQAVAALKVTDAQLAFVSPVSTYLALCGEPESPWRPLAAQVGGHTVGFVMHAVDPADNSFCIGGLIVDRRHQRTGHGRAIVRELIALGTAKGHDVIALAYDPANIAARALYADLGFTETGERDGDEVIATFTAPHPPAQD